MNSGVTDTETIRPENREELIFCLLYTSFQPPLHCSSESAVHLTTILKWELEENEKQARLQEVHYRHLLL